MLHNQGKTELAEAAFRQALTHRANMADTHYNLGILLQSEHRLAEATVAYNAAIRFALPSAPNSTKLSVYLDIWPSNHCWDSFSITLPKQEIVPKKLH